MRKFNIAGFKGVALCLLAMPIIFTGGMLRSQDYSIEVNNEVEEDRLENETLTDIEEEIAFIDENDELEDEIVVFMDEEDEIAAYKEEGNELKNKIFVSVDGNDAEGTGEIDTPFATVNRAIEDAEPGTTIYLREGIYEDAISVSASGEEDAYIHICNYPGERPILDGTSIKDEPMIDLDGQSYIEISGLELRNFKRKWAYGFYLGNGESNIIIRDNIIHDLYASKPKSSNSGANAIICFGERADKSINNILIEGNEIYDCKTGWSEAISVTGNCEYVKVNDNTVTNTGNIGIDFCGHFGYCSNPELDMPRYCEVRGNSISKANSPNATSYGLYVDGARDILLEGNRIFGSQGGIEIGAEEVTNYPTENIIVRNNLIYDNTQYGLTVGAYDEDNIRVKDIKLYDNTVVNNGGVNGELVIAIVNGLDVVNNIFHTDRSKEIIYNEYSPIYTSNVKFDGNTYSSNRTADKMEFEIYGKAIVGFSNWKAKYDTNGIFNKGVGTDFLND